MSSRRPRDILYVIGSFDLGGSERHLALIAPRLAALGWRPKVYCLERQGAQADAVEAAGVPVIAPPMELAVKRSSHIGLALGLLLSAGKLFGLLLTQRPRIVHIFLPRTYLVGGPLAVLTRAPIRIMSRRSLNLYQRGRPLVRRMEMWLHRHMSVILVNSKRVSRQLIEEEGVPPGKVRLIYNGVDLAAFDAAGPAREEAARPLTLIIVANLIPYKGHADLLQALAGVAQALPDWRLLCVGRDDGYGSELAQRARALGLEDRVQFLGERTDIPDLLKSADIGILCSHEEGFANAILEGMAAGLPMVVTDVGGNAEAIADNETGLVVPPHTPAALGAAVAALAADPSLRQRMGAAGRARAMAQFSLEACVAQYDELYRSLTGQVPKP